MTSVVSCTTFSDRTLAVGEPGAEALAGDRLAVSTRPAKLCRRRRLGEESTWLTPMGEREWGRRRGTGDGVRDSCSGLDLGWLRVGVLGGVDLGAAGRSPPLLVGEGSRDPLWEDGDAVGVGVFLGEYLDPDP